MTRRPLLPLLAALAFALTACPSGNPGGGGTELTPEPTAAGTPNGTAVTASIGPEGGSLVTADGALKVVVPPQAVSAATTLGIQPISDTGPGGLGLAYRLTPEGTTFARPVQVTFTLPAEALQAAPLNTMHVATQQHGYWTDVPVTARDAAAGSVSVETVHFSDWSAVPGVQLSPFSTHVALGGQVSLKVLVCDVQSANTPEGPFNLYDCRDNVVFDHVVQGWAVNGTPGGSASLGSITPTQPGTAAYAAPNAKPAGNPVSVSAGYHNPVDSSEVLLVASILVGDDDAAWQGTVTFTETGEQSYPGLSGFTGTMTGKFTMTYVYTVTGVKAVEGPSTTLTFGRQASATATFDGNYHREIRLECQANGPVILRYYDDRTVNERVTGSLGGSVDRRIYVDTNGGYSMFISTDTIQLTGREVAQYVEKDGCSGITSTAGSYDRDGRASVAPPYNLAIVGTGPDPKHPDHLTGQTIGKRKETGPYLTPTTWSLTWDLTRKPKP
jgi:hypothetical protein